MNNNILNQNPTLSPLDQASQLSPKGGEKKKMLETTVMLTPLVDAFSILVIYLLVSFSSSGEIITISKDMKLPEAAKAQELERSTIVRLEVDKIFIENEEIAQKDLVSKFIEIKKQLSERRIGDEQEPSLILQADKKTKYEAINQIVLAGSQTGFSEIKFAVLAK